MSVALEATGKNRNERVNDCVGAFVCVESSDSFSEANRCLKDIYKTCGKHRLDTVLLAPFSHLSHKLADPSRAIDLILRMEVELRKNNYKVFRSSFGFHKNLILDVKGCDDNIRWRSYGNEVE